MFSAGKLFTTKPICRYRLMSKHCFCNLKSCKLLILGGGPGGCSVAWRMSKVLCPDDIILVNPSKYHYFQPHFSLVAAGIGYSHRSSRYLRSVLPSTVKFIQDEATWVDVDNKIVRTLYGHTICYEYLLVAVGLRNRYDKIAGLQKALDSRHSGVSTSYSSIYCNKTWGDLSRNKGGLYVFTLPTQRVKCPAAALKIMYLIDSHLRRIGNRKNINIMFNFGGTNVICSEKYDKSMSELIRKRNITVNCNLELTEVRPGEAVFSTCNGKQQITVPFNFLHVTPPMSVPSFLSHVPGMVDSGGYLDVDMYSLQHRRYCHVYGIGDCTNTPNVKTATAVGAQSKIVSKNLTCSMCGVAPTAQYDGYGSCAVMTSHSKGIVSETNYKEVVKSFPFDQSREQRLLYLYSRFYYPHLYWRKIIRGEWDGPPRHKLETTNFIKD